MKYGFRINRDLIGTGSYGVTSPMTARTAEMLKRKGAEFRMLDDDRAVYYHGRILGEYDGFEPLDDFGEAMAGCTIIQYKDDQGVWADL